MTGQELIEKQRKEQLNYIENLKQENKELKEQLAEKDKEIEELETFNAKNIYDTICHALNMQEKQLRKQVCDKIREFIDNNEHSEENDAKQSSESVVYIRQLYKFLDQIEQAKKKNIIIENKELEKNES